MLHWAGRRRSSRQKQKWTYRNEPGIEDEAMKNKTAIVFLLSMVVPCLYSGAQNRNMLPGQDQSSLILRSDALAPESAASGNRFLLLDGLFYETAQGRTAIPGSLTDGTLDVRDKPWGKQEKMADGRVVEVYARREGKNFIVRLSAQPGGDITKWGLALASREGEYYTGLMERVVDGPQQASWAPGIKQAMDLRGQKVDMIVKPTTSLYAPYYLSSRGYAVFVQGAWPGFFDFCAGHPQRVKIEFEGPVFEMKVYMDANPAALVKAHALDAGPPVLPPKWTYTPWRWRDEHSQLKQYYDGTQVTGPFNSQVMEDVLMMKAFGIPCGVYWVDRPWGPGRLGYDDFEIDPARLPNFPEMVRWLNEQQMQMLLWIAPFYQGKMEEEALAKGYNLAGQPPQRNNYPMVDMTNPAAKSFWQEGLAKLLKLGVAAYKLDRGEENIPESGPYKVFDGRSIRENRNAYPAMYVKAAYEIAKKYRGDDFVMMPRGAYTGSSQYGVFWGGDIGGTQEGLRASIIAVQRSAVMGYPNWGSDTCGYNQQLIEQEVCGRWLAFSCFTPIMEVGPTRNLAFWSLPRAPSYDTELIAIWRLYARLHVRLMDYTYKLAEEAHRSGMPMVRPLFLVEPKAREAWTNWQTYLYGPDLVVSPIWEKARRTQEVYLPSGTSWRDVWRPDKVYQGGRTIEVPAELHQIPLFIRSGSNLKLGDLNQEYRESLAIAQQKPDLKKLDAEVKAWFEKRRQ
jgi:alpha-glucosidase (family GH31 glycosyl hydrolase)